MIRFDGVSKSYRRGPRALENVSFELGKGEFAFLTGSSGAGKTTLMRLVYREERPSNGTVTVAGRDVAALRPAQVQMLRRRLGIVFQDWRLIPTRDVFENVTFVLRSIGMDPKEQKRRALDVLRWVGLTHRMRSFPQELSGGEQQRVAIARAVAGDPDVVLADEPTGNLDDALSLEILDIFKKINARGTTVLIATHDTRLVQAVSRRVLHLDAGVLEERTS